MDRSTANGEAAEAARPGCADKNCGDRDGRLPGACADLVFPYVPMQQKNAKRYGQKEALQQGTLFPGLDLPFHRELKSRFPAANTPLSELMALDFAIDELGLYLVTHADDKDALNLYWSYIKLAREGRKTYQETYGPLLQTDITEGGYQWLNDPWPWEEGGNS
jgi:spore coat protein JB